MREDKSKNDPGTYREGGQGGSQGGGQGGGNKETGGAR